MAKRIVELGIFELELDSPSAQDAIFQFLQEVANATA